MDVLPLLYELRPDLPADQWEALRTKLADAVNELLQHDFPALVQVLYRVDVPENKLKTVLLENPGEDAGNLLADLLIRRQLEKQALKNSFRFPTDASEEERW